eukprot:349730-Chlamydomonas_euryale.AAC.5
MQGAGSGGCPLASLTVWRSSSAPPGYPPKIVPFSHFFFVRLTLSTHSPNSLSAHFHNVPPQITVNLLPQCSVTSLSTSPSTHSQRLGAGGERRTRARMLAGMPMACRVAVRAGREGLC